MSKFGIFAFLGVGRFGEKYLLDITITSRLMIEIRDLSLIIDALS